MEPKKTNPKLISLGVLIAVVVLIVAVSAINKHDKIVAAQNANVSTTAPTTNVPVTTDTAPGVYKAGTYSANGTYQDPAGEASIKITLTLSSDGTITDTSAIENPNGGESQLYQDRFVGAYKRLVVGKKINTLKLGNVSGSSLTPIGFNNALTAIKQQAKNT